MNTLQLAEAKRFLLQEIGNSPYHFSLYKNSDDDDEDWDYDMMGGKENTTTYVFSTLSDKGKSPTRYFVTIKNYENGMEDPFPEIKNVEKYKNSDELPLLDVSFGAGQTIDDTDVTGLTNKGEALRVMSTIMAIIKLEFKKNPNTQILAFMPAGLELKDKDEKEDDELGLTNTRGRVYLGYIKSEFRDGINEGLVKIKIEDYSEYIIKFDRDYLDEYLKSSKS